LPSFSFWQSSLYLTWTALAVEGVAGDAVAGPAALLSSAGLGTTRWLFEQEMITSVLMSTTIKEKQLRGLFFIAAN
jgi:hypothetical protein